jgi:hypothetical protein
MTTAGEYLDAYDRELRTDAETPGAVAVARLGPLLLVTFPGGRGFVTYRDLGDADAGAIAGLVEGALEHYRDDPGIARIEWKTRGHDRAPGLHEALVRNGFEAGETESIMIGEASLLAVDVPLPEGVELRRLTGDVAGDGVELWVAEAGGEIVSSGRLEPVAGTEFAGIWGGATRPEWRRRGIYRALTAARARSALAMGKRLIQSDSTEGSRPILERAGLVKVSTTTPYEWRAGGGHSA